MIEYVVRINKYGGTSIGNVTTARREQNPPTQLVAPPGTFPIEKHPDGDYWELREWLRGRGIEVFGANAVIHGRHFGCRVRTNLSGTALVPVDEGTVFRWKLHRRPQVS